MTCEEYNIFSYMILYNYVYFSDLACFNVRLVPSYHDSISIVHTFLDRVLRTKNGNSQISYRPPSGTYFANKTSVGRSFLVEAIATNEANNTATCRFQIHVTGNNHRQFVF